MNQYKIEMKEIFRKEILVCAESEKEATDIVEKAYLRTNMLDHSYKDLAAVETKVIGKREENNYGEMEEENIIDKESRENIKGTIDQMYENLKEMDNALVEDDIVYIDMLIENLEDNIEDLKEVVREIE
ncbi:hypothetical protein [uncultured Clostridium sp.]|jgi:SpoVK/Ycf46/Vps4 family AAA+-type ATPase|uniref:hypothetical protein n=1 Tax=uncultured Clostridium sp. TaxID=59620 RepID=UPI00272A3A63|nr:hypothetical protein [uncultured Clostridium sp.]